MQRILILGDLHAGSHVAPWPTSWLPGEPSHRISRYLTDCLAHLGANLEPIDLLILNGDLIDGPQRKSGGMGVFSPRLRDQVSGAMELLAPIVKKASKTIRVEGTPYHDDDHDPLFALDERFGIKHVAQVFDLELPGGGILNVAHHPGGGSTLYKGTKASRELMQACLAAARRKVPGTRWVVRSHLHHWLHHEEGGGTYVAVPCWQMPTAWSKKGNYWQWQPDLGAALMLRDEDHPGGWRFRQIEYDVPMPEVTRL